MSPSAGCRRRGSSTTWTPPAPPRARGSSSRRARACAAGRVPPPRPGTPRAPGGGAPRVRLNVTGVDEGDWVLRVGPDGVAYAPTADTDRPDVTLTMDVATWTDIIAGRVTAPAAVMDGRIGLEGDVMKALSLEALL